MYTVCALWGTVFLCSDLRAASKHTRCVCRGDGLEKGVIESVPSIQLWGGHLRMLSDKVLVQ